MMTRRRLDDAEEIEIDLGGEARREKKRKTGGRPGRLKPSRGRRAEA
jgi:hypothetical protein